MIKCYDENSFDFLFTPIKDMIPFGSKSMYKDFYNLVTGLAKGVNNYNGSTKDIVIDKKRTDNDFHDIVIKVGSCRLVLVEVLYDCDMSVSGEFLMASIFPDSIEIIARDGDYLSHIRSLGYLIVVCMRNQKKLSAKKIETLIKSDKNSTITAMSLFSECFMKNGLSYDTSIKRLKSAGFSDKQIYRAVSDVLRSSVWVD